MTNLRTLTFLDSILLKMIFTFISKFTHLYFGCQMWWLLFDQAQKCPADDGADLVLRLELFAREIRRAFFKESRDAFLKIL